MSALPGADIDPSSAASVRQQSGGIIHPRLSVPVLRFRDGGGLLYSTLARLIASGAAVHRGELVEQAGLARSTVTRHLEALIEAGVIIEDGVMGRPGRGRPPQRLSVNPRAGLVGVADVGALEARLAITDLAQNRLASLDIPVDLAQGPEVVLKQLEAALKELHASVGGILATGDRSGVPDGESGDLCAVTIGLPGPVDHAAGIPVRPPIMPGWDGYPVGQVLSERFGCPVLVDNDANLMALGEARTLPGDQLPLLFVTVSTGIGGGLVSAEGELHRGADGAAGDIGHLPVRGADDVVCRCGNTGCVEAVASAAAMIGRLERERAARPGSLTESAEDALTGEQELARLIRHGDPAALRIVRDAAEHIGEVVALLVHVCNPARVVLGGTLASVGDELVARVRGVVYHRALPLATRNLRLETSRLGEQAGRVGGAVLGVEQVLSPDGIADLMQRQR